MIRLIMDELIAQLVTQQKHATPAELVDIANHIAVAPFSSDLLEVDEPLWGSFWQFDVIAPGYTLPAIELNLLRAIRLDKNWPEETTTDQFLADLRQAIPHPKAGIWTLSIAGEPFIVFAAPIEPDKSRKSQIAQSGGLHRVNRKSITVVWYCASTGQLHAGYRVATEGLHFAGAIIQRQPEFTHQQLMSEDDAPDWLASAVQQVGINEESSLAARIDAGILRIRLDGLRG